MITVSLPTNNLKLSIISCWTILERLNFIFSQIEVDDYMRRPTTLNIANVSWVYLSKNEYVMWVLEQRLIG